MVVVWSDVDSALGAVAAACLGGRGMGRTKGGLLFLSVPAAGAGEVKLDTTGVGERDESPRSSFSFSFAV